MFSLNNAASLNRIAQYSHQQNTIDSNQWTAIIAPPITLTAQHLSEQGIATSSALIIHKAKIVNKFNTLLKAAQSPTISSIVTWSDDLTEDEIFKIRSTMKANNKRCLIQACKKLH